MAGKAASARRHDVRRRAIGDCALAGASAWLAVSPCEI